MSNQPSNELTVDIALTGDDQTVIDILHAQYGHLEAGEARAMLETQFPGDVWTDEELVANFSVSHFEPLYLHVIRSSDGVRGTLMFLDSPRFYFSFNAESDPNVTGTT
jgi:hypothetical protein